MESSAPLAAAQLAQGINQYSKYPVILTAEMLLPATAAAAPAAEQHRAQQCSLAQFPEQAKDNRNNDR